MKFALKILLCCLLFYRCGNSGQQIAVPAEGKQQNTIADSCDDAIIEKRLITSDSALILPKVTFVDPAIAEKINAHFTLENVSGYTLQEIKEQQEKFKKDSIPFGLTTLGYEVTYNKNCLLSLTCYMETNAAYPSAHSVYFNFDLRTGDSLTYVKLIRPEKTNSLVLYCDSILQARIAETRKHDYCDEFVSEQLQDKKFARESLSNFYVTETDYVFVYFFGFPHALLGAEPDGEIKISRDKMKEYLK